MKPKTPEGRAARYIKFWRDFGPNTDYIDLDKIFHELILPMSNGDQCTIVHRPLNSIEGLMIFDKDSGKWRIGVNSNTISKGRKRFTLAHEIGHFDMHRSNDSKFECSYSDLSDYHNSKLEKEANEFASFLLMPPDVFRHYSNEEPFTHDKVIEIAHRFGVSREAAAYRLLRMASKSKIAFIKSRDGFIISCMVSSACYRSGIFLKKDEEVPSSIDCHSLLAAGEKIHFSENIKLNDKCVFACGEVVRSERNDFDYYYLEIKGC